jgi:hypothetical protein
MATTRKPGEVVSLFRRESGLDDVPEVVMPDLPVTHEESLWTNGPAVDLSDQPKLWCLSGAGATGKTTEARWLVWRMAEAKRSAGLVALDPGNRSLASWFENVEQPASRDGAHTARYLRELLEHLMRRPSSTLIDFGGGDTALARVLETAPDLHQALEDAGIGVVACYTLSPRVDDLDTLSRLERAGFRPKATLLLLNEGRADPTVPRAEAFRPVIRHSIFKNAIARGVIARFMPSLESDVMQDVETKRLHWGMARDGLVPEGVTYSGIGGLSRSMVRRWLERMEDAHKPVLSWLL